jgi:hypothetical protein
MAGMPCGTCGAARNSAEHKLIQSEEISDLRSALPNADQEAGQREL